MNINPKFPITFKDHLNPFKEFHLYKYDPKIAQDFPSFAIFQVLHRQCLLSKQSVRVQPKAPVQ